MTRCACIAPLVWARKAHKHIRRYTLKSVKQLPANCTRTASEATWVHHAFTSATVTGIATAGWNFTTTTRVVQTLHLQLLLLLLLLLLRWPPLATEATTRGMLVQILLQKPRLCGGISSFTRVVWSVLLSASALRLLEFATPPCG